MKEPIDIQEIILWVFRNISSELGVPYDGDCPTPSEVSIVCGKIEGKLGIARLSQGKGEDGSHKSLYKVLKGIDKSEKPRWAHRLSFLLYHLRNYPTHVDVASEYNRHNYGEYWKQDKAAYYKQQEPQTVEYVDKKFWKNKTSRNLKALQQYFLVECDSNYAPQAVASKISLPDFSDRIFSWIQGNTECTGNLAQLIESNVEIKSSIFISSKEHGEGKTTFIWQFLKKYDSQFNFFIVNDGEFSFDLLPPTSSLMPTKPIVIVLDGVLKKVDNDFYLKRIFEDFEYKYESFAIALVICDSVFYKTKSRDSIKQLAQYVDDQIEVSFSLTNEENLEIFKNLTEVLNLDDAQASINAYDFAINRKDQPLILRIVIYLKAVSNRSWDWEIWENDISVKQRELEHLYWIISFLTYCNISLPEDYSSTRLLPNKQDDELHDLIAKTPAFKSFISVSDYRTEYPHIYLALANKSMAEACIRCHPHIERNINRFIEDIISIIKAGNAQSSHAYIYRKLYDNQKALALPFLKSNMLLLGSNSLFIRLLESSQLNSIDIQKCKGELITYLIRQENFPEAHIILETIPQEQRDGTLLLLEAQILFNLGYDDECLEILPRLDDHPSAALLKFRCYSRVFKSPLEILPIYFNSDHIYSRDIRYIFKLIKKIASQKNFELAEEYYDELHSRVTSKSDVMDNYPIVHLKAKLYHKWAEFEFESSRPQGIKRSDYYSKDFFDSSSNSHLNSSLEMISYLVDAQPKNMKVLNTYADLLKWLRRNDEAYLITQKILKLYPRSITTLALEAYILMNRENNSDKEQDYKIALANLILAKQLLSTYASTFETQANVFKRLSSLYLKMQNYQASYDTANEFIKRHPNKKHKDLESFHTQISYLIKMYGRFIIFG
ncbi:MAG: hypothetical protein JSS76_16270 [Bacteroidetes bacterium]|nr:hypothetical protein [Bacteroidota bacterium]